MSGSSAHPLKAGVFAAGHGSRLRTESNVLKPLVKVGTQTLIEHVLGSMSDAGATEVAIIINEGSLAVREHVAARTWPFTLRWIVETTPDVTLALTDPADDEKPLLVRLDPGSSKVIAIGQSAAPSPYATAGIYAVRASILREADAARRDGLDALRSFLGRLFDRGYQLAGIPIAATIDVDRPTDIKTANEFLRSVSV